MYGSVDHYSNCLKSAIVNNLVLMKSITLEESLSRLKTEAERKDVSQENKNLFLNNIEKAYIKVRMELFGMEEDV